MIGDGDFFSKLMCALLCTNHVRLTTGMRFRGSIKPMDEEPENILDLSLMVEEIPCPRLLTSPDSHRHREPLGQVEDIFIRFIITNIEQPGLLQVVHEGQDGRSFPVCPRGQDIHRGFPKDQARRET